MSEIKEFLLENEEIVFKLEYTFFPFLFGDEAFYLTNIRSIKVKSPGLLSRKTFKFLPHIEAHGHALSPIMDWAAVIIWGLMSFLALTLLSLIIFGVEDVEVYLLFFALALILSVVIVFLKGKQVFAIFGEPTIKIIINDEKKAKIGSKILAKLQDGIIVKNS